MSRRNLCRWRVSDVRPRLLVESTSLTSHLILKNNRAGGNRTTEETRTDKDYYLQFTVRETDGKIERGPLWSKTFSKGVEEHPVRGTVDKVITTVNVSTVGRLKTVNS